jgi:hypothetical protein
MGITNQDLWLPLFNHDSHERCGCRAEYDVWDLVAMDYRQSWEMDGQGMEEERERLVETGSYQASIAKLVTMAMAGSAVAKASADR